MIKMIKTKGLSKDELECLNKKYNSKLFRSSLEVVFVCADGETWYGTERYAASKLKTQSVTTRDVFVWATPVFERQIQCLELKVEIELEITVNGLKYRLVEGQ